MAMRSKQNRKSISYLTPQSQKIRASPSRLTLSSNDENSQRLFETLLNDPLKRTLLMQVLTQDISKTNGENKKEKSNIIPRKKVNKLKFESPTALYRRRALEEMQKIDESSHYHDNNHIEKVPFKNILKGVVAYVEIKSRNEDRSAGAKALMQAMGADIREVISRQITHVVFKDGCLNTYRKARLLKVHLVSVLWLEAVRSNQYRVPEKDYPALGATSSNANASLLCKQFQKDYEDLIQDELRKTNLSNTIYSESEDVIDTSQNFDIRSLQSVKSIVKPKDTILTPNSLCLDSTPDITSDSDSETCLQKHNELDNQQSDLNITEGNSRKKFGKQLDFDANNIKQSSNISNNSIRKSSDCEELSSLRISEGSANNTPLNKIPQYNNITQRKKRVDFNKSINILETFIVKPKNLVNKENKELKEITNNVYENDIYNSFENLCIETTADKEIRNDKSLKRKSIRKLYNIDDHQISNSIITRKKPAAGSDDDFVESHVKINSKVPNTAQSPIKNCPITPRNKQISVTRKCATTPRRRSSRLINVETDAISPPKRTRRNSAGEDNIVENNLDKDIAEETPVLNNKENITNTGNRNSDMKFDESVTNRLHSKTTRNQRQALNIKSNTSILRRKSTRLTNIGDLNCNSQKNVKGKESPSNKARNSSFDFIPKESIEAHTKSKKNISNVFSGTKIKSTQHKSIKKVSIVCTRFHSTEVQVFQQIVKKLGVFFVEDEVTEKTTHLVVAESKRTINLLRAMARGCWILKSEWLYRSLEADQWLPEEDYELCEFSDAVQKTRQERQAFGSRFSMDIFSNCGHIYISKGTNPRCSDLQELVSLCKGAVTTILRNANIVVGEYVENKQCVTVNWVMDCITFYKKKSLKPYTLYPESD